jgi:putative membrane protein
MRTACGRASVSSTGLTLLCALPAFAHEGEDHGLPLWDVATALVLLTIAALYATGSVRLWRSPGGRSTIRRWQATAFFAGWASAAAALLSPLDRWSDVLFSAHMAQHEILMLISAPLMVAGRPFIAVLWAFSAGGRERIGAALRARPLQRGWEVATGPVTVLILHAVVLWIWHVPVFFEAALRNETVHVVQHLGFFVTAALFWWALIHGRYGKLGYGIAVLYVFATAMHTQILGALLTFGTRIWYPTHAARTTAAGMSAVDDQQFAGVLMWIPFGVVFLVVGLALFAAWLGEAERRATLGLVVVVALLSAQCRPQDDRTARQLTGGEPDRGRQVLRAYGCGACHTVPGVMGARGLVGPPLRGIGSRTFLAGQLPNTPENLKRWIRSPQSVAKGTAMPDLNVSEQDARDMAAYLYTLRE